MTIFTLLKSLFEKDNHHFIQVLYWQILNRNGSPLEVYSGIQELQHGKSKLDVLKRVMGSMEATRLYLQPLPVLGMEYNTICQIIRTFYRADPFSFFKRAFLEICGHEPMVIHEDMIRFVTRGINYRTLFIMNLIDYHQSDLVRDITGFYPTVRDWITASKNTQFLYPIYQEEVIEIPEPKGIEKTVQWNKLVDTNKVPEQFVVDIPEGIFWGEENGAVITPDYKIIEEVSQEMFSNYIFHNKKVPFLEDKKGNFALLYSYYAKNYFHFMFDVVARLYLLQKSNVPIDWFVTNSQLPFQDQLLTLLGIPPEKRIQMDGSLHFKADHLMIPSYIYSHKGLIPRWACDFLRRELLINRKVNKLQDYARIYISREKAQHRKVINEDEIMDLLEPYGFKRVILELEPVSRQIEIFHSAKIVVAPLGAGLTNLLFSNPETKVIELFSPTWVRPVFRLISHHMGLDYYYFLGEKIPELYKVDDYRRMWNDIFVNPKKLKDALSCVLSKGEICDE